MYHQTTTPTSEAKNNLPKQHQICNISNYKLSEIEEEVLSKGLSFCPTPTFYHFELIKDIMTLARNLRLKHYFANQNHIHDSPTSTNKADPSLLKFQPPSDWDPPPLPSDHPIEQYINLIVQNVAHPSFAKAVTDKANNNLKPTERKAIKSLKENDSIMILPADKGSTTVVMNKTDYIQEIENQLSDTTTYRLLDKNPTTQFTEELRNLINIHAKSNNISPATVELLIPENPNTPKIYVLPKIHKNITPPPGRPIVAGYGSLTERISAYVDSFLQPIVQNLPSFIKDTGDFLKKLSNFPQPLPQNAILVTVDVSSLYTNIPHLHGIAAVEHFLQKRPTGTLPTTSFILNLVRFILEKNHFQFLEKHYLQIKGTAMGTRMAPSYANLYMGKVEESFLKTQTLQPLCWLRYIDDVFLIWTHGQDRLELFLDNLNSCSPLKFTWEYSELSINFLDVTVKNSNGSIITTVHTKPTNHQQYLHFNSCHPNNTKRSLPYSLALRGLRINTNEEDAHAYNRKLLTAFEKRGYPTQLVKSQITAATNNINRPKPKLQTNNEPVNLVTTYHPGLPKLNSLLNSGFKILQNSSQTKDLFKEPPRLVYRQPPNLKNMLVRPKLPDPSANQSEPLPQGSYPCNSNRCKTCNIHKPTTTFSSSTHNIEYKIKGHHTCTSENLVYQLECQQCQAQYVGMTKNTLRERMNGHRQDVKTEREKPVAIHAKSHNIDFDKCFTTKVIKSLPKDQCNPSMLRRWELAYQYVTDSRTPPPTST